MNGKNENNAKYMIFSPSGEMPTNTLAAIEDEQGIQIIANGSGGNILKLFGSICKALNENDANIPVKLLTSTAEIACETGRAWELIFSLAEHRAEKTAEKVKNGEMSMDEAVEELKDEIFGGGDDD